MSKAEKSRRCKEHHWFPIAIDYSDSFMVLECAECSTRVWANVHRLGPEEEE